MKQCISRVISYITHLWQTLKQYVCKRKTKYPKISMHDFNSIEIDLDRDGQNEFEWYSDVEHDVPIIQENEVHNIKEDK